MRRPSAFAKDFELAFCVFTIGAQRVFSSFRIAPPGRHRHNLVVKATGIRSVERESTKQDNPWDGVGGLPNKQIRQATFQDCWADGLGLMLFSSLFDDPHSSLVEVFTWFFPLILWWTVGGLLVE